MNRLVFVLAFVSLMAVVNVASACNRCHRSHCRGCGVATASCCDNYGSAACCQPVCHNVYRTTYVNVVKCVPVTRCKRVTYRDCCGCCRTKLVRCTSYVQRCVRVPVTTCETVCTMPAPIASPCCDNCCSTDSCCSGHGGFLSRLRGLCCR
jgi:hypothetical protein